jgi:hypothetical protein
MCNTGAATVRLDIGCWATRPDSAIDQKGDESADKRKICCLPKAVGEVGLPESTKALVGHDPTGAVTDAAEWLLEGAGLEQLTLVLDHLCVA